MAGLTHSAWKRSWNHKVTVAPIWSPLELYPTLQVTESGPDVESNRVISGAIYTCGSEFGSKETSPRREPQLLR